MEVAGFVVKVVSGLVVTVSAFVELVYQDIKTEAFLLADYTDDEKYCVKELAMESMKRMITRCSSLP